MKLINVPRCCQVKVGREGGEEIQVLGVGWKWTFCVTLPIKQLGSKSALFTVFFSLLWILFQPFFPTPPLLGVARIHVSTKLATSSSWRNNWSNTWNKWIGTQHSSYSSTILWCYGRLANENVFLSRQQLVHPCWQCISFLPKSYCGDQCCHERRRFWTWQTDR